MGRPYANNCPVEVVVCFESAGLDIGNENMDELERLKGRKLRPILDAVLACSVCSQNSGRACHDLTSLDVLEAAIAKNLLSDERARRFFPDGNI